MMTNFEKAEIIRKVRESQLEGDDAYYLSLGLAFEQILEKLE